MDATGGPIHSLYEDDPAHAVAIEAFVVALAERVDALQDNELSADWPQLIANLSELANAAERTGYPQLAASAGEVARAARERHAELTYKSLVELTEIARRVRAAHRGSL